MLTSGYLVEYTKVFDDTPTEFSSSLQGIGIDLIVDFCSHFLSLRPNHPDVINYQDLLSVWFSEENTPVRDHIIHKINQLHPILRENPQIINVYCIYQLFEYSIQELPPTTSLVKNEQEISLFKSVLILNEQFNKREKLVQESLEGVDRSIDLITQGITQFLCLYDLSSYDLRELVFTQSVKSILLFKFLEEFNNETRSILQRFLEINKITDWKEYLRGYLKLCHGLISPDREGILTISLEDNPTSIFLNRIIVDETVVFDDIDFIRLRNKPLFKIDEKRYRVISPLFTCEKIYQGLFFQLTEVNSQLKNEKLPHISGDFMGFRRFYTTEFSEKYLFYQIMDRTIPKKYTMFSGETLRELGESGTPDYYVRNGNKVFLFESKDVLLNKEIKQSNDFRQIELGLKEKFYTYQQKGETRNVGIFQLLGNIKKILSGEVKFDQINIASVRIYPILVLYHNVYNTPGINGLVNHWFQSELKILRADGIPIHNVHDIVLVDINVFILYHELFKSRKIRLDQLLEEYINLTKRIVPPLSSKPKRERFFDSIVPFSMYVANVFDKKGYGKSLGLFRELGITLVEM